MINRISTGVIAWTALISLTTDARGLSPAGSDLKLIARTGDLTPGTAGRPFKSIDPPNINNSGRVAFSAILDCCAPLSTVYSSGRGTLELIAFQNMPVEPSGQFDFATF